jgi:anti-sigma factor RsiW
MDTCLVDALKLDYLNDLLSEKDRTRFEEHLAACPGCRREIVELRSTVTAVAGLTSPSVPRAWTAVAKDRLRAKRSSPGSPVPARPAPARRRTNAFQYGVIAAGVTAALVLLLWLVLGGTVRRWLPGLSTAALGISDPRAARIIDLVALILSLHALMFVPSIIDNIYQLVQSGGRRTHPGPSAGFFAC